MDKKLFQHIRRILERGDSLFFEIDEPTQGGHNIRVKLNDELIGEVYQYNKQLEIYENVLKGSDTEIELGIGIKEWIYEDFFDFLTDNHELLGESYNCFFDFEKNGLILRISGVRSWDEEDEEIDGYMEIK